MATYFFGMNRGESEYTPPTDAATTTGKDIEIAINTTANVPSMEDLLLHIDKLENYILQRGKVW